MTVEAQRKLEGLRTELREAGLRATPARLAVFGVLRAAGNPLSHAEVVERLEGEPFDRATVFRNLVALAETSLVSRTDLGDHVWRFEAVRLGKAVPHEHPHFLCLSCGIVRCMEGVELTLGTRRGLPKSLRTGTIEVQLRGLCDDCT